MLINNKTNELLPDADQLFADGIIYIHTSQWLLAYPAFAHLCGSTKNRSVSLLYNMALCHIFAKEYSKAIGLLEEALANTSVPSVSLQTPRNLPADLSSQEYQSDNHQLPLTETTISLNMPIVKLRIRRLMVDVHLQLQNWQEVMRLSALPEMNQCKNVIDAILVAKNNINSPS